VAPLSKGEAAEDRQHEIGERMRACRRRRPSADHLVAIGSTPQPPQPQERKGSAR
jgi:hypothetical protein